MIIAKLLFEQTYTEVGTIFHVDRSLACKVLTKHLHTPSIDDEHENL